MRIHLPLKIISLFFLFSLPVLFPMQSQTYDYEELAERIRNDVRVGLKDAGILDSWVAAQLSNGRWSNFSYGQLTSSNGMNTNDNHVLRLWHLSAVVTNKGHARYNNESYKQAVKNGLDAWYQSKTSDANWWYNWIYCPQKLGEILLFMREFEWYIPAVSSSEISEEKIFSLFKPSNVSQISAYGTGANAIDVALHFVYRGVLTEKATLLEEVRDFLTPTLDDNIRSDGVYQDHGPQIQISSYGYVFSDGLIRLASYLAGSPAAFDLNSESFSKAVRFIRETQIASIRGSQWDFSVMGREVSRINGLNAGLPYLKKLADFIDPEHAETYTNALDRIKGYQAVGSNVKEMHKHYWNSDYTQHVRSSYLFAVRNVSTRTVEAETGNNENLKANYFSYGATFISVDGNEYKNMMPYWDWSMIPGTTFPYTTTYPNRPAWGANFGSTTFVGGVSDGQHGATVLDMNKSNMKAKKSWFFFDDEVVCLGAGITENSGRNVRTTLNQARMEQPSYIKEVGGTAEKMQTVSSGVYANSNLFYLRNGKIAYFFPDKGNVKYTMKSQSGRWSDINVNGSTTTESGYVFSLWFDHGENPVDGSYSYIVVPGIDSQPKAQAYDTSVIDIISNTSSLQAVAHKGLNILQIIFHQAGSISYNNTTYTVNAPCALMIKEGTMVSMADPSQTRSSVTVSIDAGSTTYQKEIMLASDEELGGTTVSVDMSEMSTVSLVNADEAFQCFPNPTRDGRLTLRSACEQPSFLEVRSLLGSLILEQSFQSETMIDLSDQPSGVYLLSLQSNKQQYSRKIIKY